MGLQDTKNIVAAVKQVHYISFQTNYVAAQS